jgi:hypothetical protein
MIIHTHRKVFSALMQLDAHNTAPAASLRSQMDASRAHLYKGEMLSPNPPSNDRTKLSYQNKKWKTKNRKQE